MGCAIDKPQVGEWVILVPSPEGTTDPLPDSWVGRRCLVINNDYRSYNPEWEYLVEYHEEGDDYPDEQCVSRDEIQRIPQEVG